MKYMSQLVHNISAYGPTKTNFQSATEQLDRGLFFNDEIDQCYNSVA